MVEFHKIGEWTPATGGGGDSGDKFSFRQVPDKKGDETLYVRRIIVRSKFPSIVVASGKTLAEGALLKLFSNLQLDIPGVGTVVKLTGLDTHRLYRMRHGHIPTASPAVATSTTASRSWMHIIEFAHPNDQKKHNGIIPVATLRRSTFKAYARTIADTTFAGAADVVTALGTDGLVEVYAETVRLKGRRIPTLFIQDYEERAAERTPKYEPGRYIEAFLVPAADADWTATDFANITATFGDVAHLPEQIDQRVIVENFNSWLRDQQAGIAGVGRLNAPVDAGGTVHDFIPLLQLTPPGPGGEAAKFLSSERVDAAASPQLTFNAAPTKQPKLVRTRIADPGSWQDQVYTDLGRTGSDTMKVKLASKTVPKSAETMAIAPKSIGRAE